MKIHSGIANNVVKGKFFEYLRYVNHLCPKIFKEKWTKEEEKILFLKHMEVGNKWSIIAEFLPNRSLVSIKNIFYAKFRKFLRKALSQLQKENLIKLKDEFKINWEKLYQLIKKLKITFGNLTKEKILDIINQHYDSLLSFKCR